MSGGIYMVHGTGSQGRPMKRPFWTPGKPPWVPGPPPWWVHHSSARWLIIGYAHGWRGEVQDVKVITDVECHLFLRYTDKPLRLHLHERRDRGSIALKTPDYCFVEWTEIEEDDPGDHYHHIFHIPSFGPGVELWYYLRGTIDGNLADSVSCAFQVKYHEESQMITIGIYDEEQTLEGEVKLEEGDKIRLTRDDAHNSIIIESLVKELADLDDVSDAPNDDDVLTWEAATELWKPKPVAAVGVWTIVEEQTIPGDAHQVTFDSIPDTYKHLRILIIARAQGNPDITWRYNEDGGGNYWNHFSHLSAAYSCSTSAGTTFNVVGRLNDVNFFPIIIDIANAEADAWKGFNARGGDDDAGRYSAGSWHNLIALINRIDLFASAPPSANVFRAGARFTLLAR